MSVTRSPRPPIAQKFQCFSLPEHNKEQYVESCHTNTCAHFHCLARDNEVLLLLHNCGLHCCYRRSFPVFAGSTVALHHFCSFPQTKNAFMTTLSLLSSSIACCHGCFYPQLKNGDGSNFECKDEILERCRALKADVFSPQKGIFCTETKQEAFQRFGNKISFNIGEILRVQHLALIDKNLFTWDTYKESNKRQLLKKLWRFSFPTLLW